MDVKKSFTSIRSLVNLTRADFETLYQPVINRFSDYVGNLISYHSKESSTSLHELGLSLARSALKLRRGYLLPSGEHVENSHREQEVWTYAVFSSALFQPLAEVPAQLCEEKNLKPESVWMLGIAKALLPDAGFKWLHDNKKVFLLWVDSLGESQEENVIADIIQQARGHLSYLPSRKNLEKEPQPTDFAEEHSSHQQPLTPDNFFKWLQVEIQANRISMDERDSIVHRVEAGMLVVLPDAVIAFTENNHPDLKKKKRYQLINQIKKGDGKMGSFHWGDWEAREMIKGIIMPDDFITHDKPCINSNLHIDPINL